MLSLEAKTIIAMALYLSGDVVSDRIMPLLSFGEAVAISNCGHAWLCASRRFWLDRVGYFPVCDAIPYEATLQQVLGTAARTLVDMTFRPFEINRPHSGVIDYETFRFDNWTLNRTALLDCSPVCECREKPSTYVVGNSNNSIVGEFDEGYLSLLCVTECSHGKMKRWITHDIYRPVLTFWFNERVCVRFNHWYFEVLLRERNHSHRFDVSFSGHRIEANFATSVEMRMKRPALKRRKILTQSIEDADE